MGDGNEARLGAPVWCGTNSWSAGSRGQIEHHAGYADHKRRTQKAVPKFTEKLKDLRPPAV